jgi:phage tail-like protein
LFLDACVPPGCAFVVESRAADQLSELALVPWQAEPDPYRRDAGSELPWVAAAENSHAGTWETLLQNAHGRYLQLRLTLLGNGRATPRISALRVYYPRFSWLEHYLPAAWRRDPVSAAFVERWLANPEGLFTALEDRLAAVHCLFDARSVPAETLDWLGSWFGLALTDGWSDQRKRLLLRHADQLFRERGTPSGLLRALRLAVDPHEQLEERLFTGVPDGGPWGIRLIEHFLLGADDWSETWDTDAYRAFLVRRYGHIESLAKAWKLEANPPADFTQAASAELPEGAADADRALFIRLIQPARRRAHRFSVLLPKQDCDPALNEKVRQVLAREAPAHTCYEIAEYELALRVGSARLGVDSVLGAQTGWTPLIIDQSHLGLSWLAPPSADAGRWPADRYPLNSTIS